MTYREVRVFEVREALRLWLRGEGFRSIERTAQLDRKTVRRYVSAAEALGLVRDGGEAQLSDGFIGQVVEAVRPHRSDGHASPWRQLVANHDEVKADARRRAEEWCTLVAGLRIHGTTQARPAEVFATEERHLLLAAPAAAYDLPTYPKPKVHRDHHIEVDKALYSVPGNLIGHHVDVRADRSLVRIFHRGQLIKVHARTHVGDRRTDPADLPDGKTPYAMRDLERPKAMAAEQGPAVGAYAAALLDTPLPWTRMRQVYALLGLVKRWGAELVDAACARAIDAEAVTGVSLIGRMLERATEGDAARPPAAVAVAPGRFARDPGHFASNGSNRAHPGVTPGLEQASTGVSEGGSRAAGGAM